MAPTRAHGDIERHDVLGKRALALIVDFIVVGIAAGIIGGAFLLVSTELAIVGYMVAGLLSFVYFIYMEGAYGQTVGKMVLNIVVVKEDGSPVGYVDALIRNLLRIIDTPRRRPRRSGRRSRRGGCVFRRSRRPGGSRPPAGGSGS